MPGIRRAAAIASSLIVLAYPGRVVAQGGPTTDDFKRALDAAMQKLRPTGFTARALLFENVRAGAPSGGYFPFMVTATLSDYAPGYPANRYYGQTCVGRMDGWKFDMRRDDFGGWLVQGRMTVTNSECKDNSSAGTSAIPLAGLAGTPAAAGSQAPAAGARAPAAAATPAAGALYFGEYACYGTGGRPVAGMGFLLQSGGRYQDSDNERGGTYAYDAGAATIAFRGGFLDGQTARNVRGTGFSLSSTVSCEPYP